MTFGMLRAQVAARMDDPEQPFSFTDAEINAAINRGQLLFSTMTLCLEAQVPYAITLGAYFSLLLYYLPDWIATLRVTNAAGSKIRPATLQQLDALDSQWKLDHGPVKRYGTQGDLMIFYGCGVQTATLTYAQAAPVLVFDSDVPAIAERFHPVLADYGIYHLAKRLGGQILTKARGDNWKRFLEAAQGESARVLAKRTQGLGYDTAPFELTQAALAAAIAQPKGKK